MILVEVLGRRGTVVHRVRTTGGELAIGRAYDCDVILDDPYVDARALRLTVAEDGALSLHDLGASNPVTVGDRRMNGGVVDVAEGDVVKVGRTRLRIVRASTAVAPALVERAGRLGSWVAGRVAAPVVAIAFCVAWGLTSYAAEIEDFTAAMLLGELVGLLLFVAVWAGVWALATRLAQGRSAFREHTTWTLLAASASMPVGSFFGVLAFLWPGALTDALGVVSFLVLFALLLDAHLGLASRLRRRSRLLLASAISISLMGVIFVVEVADPTYESPVQSALGPPYPVSEGMIPAVSTEGFLASTEELERKLAEMAQED